MTHLYSLICGVIVGSLVWFSTGDSGLGFIVAISLGALLSLGQGLRAVYRVH